jgi:hypothetical protein
MVSLFVFCHSLKGLLEVRILPLGHRNGKHLNVRAGKSLEGAVVRRFDNESAVHGIVGIGSAEGVHRVKIRDQAYRGVIILCARDKFEYARQSRARLADNNINCL